MSDQSEPIETTEKRTTTSAPGWQIKRNPMRSGEFAEDRLSARSSPGSSIHPPPFPKQRMSSYGIESSLSARTPSPDSGRLYNSNAYYSVLTAGPPSLSVGKRSMFMADYPSSADYDPVVSTVKPQPVRNIIGKDPRERSPRLIFPGPADYSPVRSKKVSTFFIERVSKSRSRVPPPSEPPGPADYCPIPVQRHAEAFPLVSRHSFSPKVPSPGPSDYSPTNVHLKRSPRYVISAAGKRTDFSNPIVGPGSYENGCTTLYPKRSVPAYTIPSKYYHNLKFITPGPGSYKYDCEVQNSKQSYPAYSIPPLSSFD